MLKIVLVFLLIAGLSACATVGSSNGGAAYRDANTVFTSPDTDVEKVAAVNKWAHDRGAKLIWVNYPQKPKSASSAPGASGTSN
ncbi:MAG TPA: hypothetical protein VFB32_07705 [Rudaea sp.]|jgi:hypothetical protein|nr:hypothetical protein [Rudaea sp.]